MNKPPRPTGKPSAARVYPHAPNRTDGRGIQLKAAGVVARPEPSAGRQGQKPVAPPVYRPMPEPKVLQKKSAVPVAGAHARGSQSGSAVLQPKVASLGQARQTPKAPAVYRPLPAPKVLQTKMATGRQEDFSKRGRTPAAPEVYRPQPLPRVLQRKTAEARPAAAGRPAATSPRAAGAGPSSIQRAQARIVSPPSPGRNPSRVIQRVRDIQVGKPVRGEHLGDMPCEGTVKAVVKNGDAYIITLTSYDNQPVTAELLSDYGLEADVEIPERWVKEKTSVIKTVPQQGVTITHFSPRGKTSAEFVDSSKKRIDVTNHGMGTGVYGIANATQETIGLALAHDPKSVAYTVTMTNPLYLQDGQHGEEFTRLSKGLQRLLVNMTKASEKGILIPPRYWKKYQQGGDNLEASVRAVFGRVGKEVDSVNSDGEVAKSPSGLIETVINKFYHKYYNGESPLQPQPINVMMETLGYDGVYADNPQDNTFNRGCVAYQYITPSSNVSKERIHQ